MLKTFGQFLLAEGGNISVEGGSASPFPLTARNRQSRVDDIHHALSDLHDQYHKETGEHLFGKNKSGLTSGSTYAGSTRALMNPKLSHKDVASTMPSVGDVDAQMHHDHKNQMAQFLFPGRLIGKYMVVGTKKHGNEVSAVMKHENGEHHQFDFEGVHTDPKTGESTPGEQFLHSADFSDRQSGIKGLHHKVLLNAIASANNQKFSITHGLRSRDSAKDDPGISNPDEVSSALFGPKADASKVHSFKGLSELIRDHVHPDNHAGIYQKFADSVSKMKGADHTKAIAHLGKTLGIQQDQQPQQEPQKPEPKKAPKKPAPKQQQQEEHHTSVIPLTGFSPISHMGHAQDLGSALSRLPGTKHVGVSSKSDVYTPEERKHILRRQWDDADNTIHTVKSAGETIRAAHESLPEGGRKVLHILVGHDRADFAHGLKRSLEAGKIKEMEGRQFDDIQVHHPEDSDRSHGMSGTNMRTAASRGDVDEVHRHIGPMFSRAEAEDHTKRMADAIKSGAIKVKR
jgi:hypothetical protein